MSVNQKTTQKQDNKTPRQNNAVDKKPVSTIEHVSGLSLQQALEDPSTTRPEALLDLQKMAGNQVVQRALTAEKEEDPLTNQQGHLNDSISDEIKRARSGGQPLNSEVSREMGGKFKHDFDPVRVHTDSKADKLNHQMQARAFTLGNDIFFRSGAYNPGSEQGRHTLTHELTHVVQQSGSSESSGPLTLGDVDTPHENQAERIAGASAAQDVQNAPAKGEVQRELAPAEEELMQVLSPALAPESGQGASPAQQEMPPALEALALSPAQQAPSPGQGSSPAQQELPPALEALAQSPAQQAPSPGQGSSPAQQEMPPALEALAPSPAQQAPSLGQGSSPAQQEMPPALEALAQSPAQQAPSPGQSSSPAQQEMPPALEALAQSPAQQAPSPGQSSSPAQQEMPPALEALDSSPAQQAPSPGQSSSLAQQEMPPALEALAQSPAQQAPSPGEGSSPAQQEMPPALEALDSSPAQQEPTSEPEEPSPVQDPESESSPAQEAPISGTAPPMPALEAPTAGPESLSPAKQTANSSPASPAPEQEMPTSDTSPAQQAPTSGTSPAQQSLPPTMLEEETVQAMRVKPIRRNVVQRGFFGSIKSGFARAKNKITGRGSGSTTPAPSTKPSDATQAQWDSLNSLGVKTTSDWGVFLPAQKTFLKANLEKSYTKKLISAGKAGNWPKDGGDVDIFSDGVLEFISSDANLSFSAWNRIEKTKQKPFIIANYSSDKKLMGNLAKAGYQGKWPKDASDTDTVDLAVIKFIYEDVKMAFSKWNSGVSQSRRTAVLTGKAANLDWAIELARAASKNNWPKDGSGSDLASWAAWSSIKTALNEITPAIWNKLEDTVRTSALAASTQKERNDIIRKGRYQTLKKESDDHWAAKVAENPIVEAISGTAGTAGDIVGATGKGRASGITGSVVSGLEIGLSGISLGNSIRNWYKGKKMANANTSRAGRSLGRKKANKGKWGVLGSTLGLAGGISSLTGNISKSIDPSEDNQTAKQAGQATGVMSLLSGTLSTGLEGKSFFGALNRRKKAGNYLKDANDTSVSGEDQKLSEVAKYTRKNQNRFGKLLGVGKGISTMLSGISGIVGDDIFQAVTGGIGVVSGLAQAGYEHFTKSKGADLETQAQKLVDLLKLNDAKAKNAAKFAHDVLKITDIDPNADPETWKEWVEEDEVAAKDLIKSKISKNA